MKSANRALNWVKRNKGAAVMIALMALFFIGLGVALA
jgi:putative effector of murein hydrolase LrgA (UPF0299 family)